MPRPEPFVEAPYVEMTPTRTINISKYNDINTGSNRINEVMVPNSNPIPTINAPPFAQDNTIIAKNIPVQVQTPEIILPKQIPATRSIAKEKMD